MKIAAGSLVLLAAALPAQPPADRTFTDAVEVAESSVVIELPRLRGVRPSDFESGDFVVEVAGERRRVTGVSALDLKANPRPVFVYVDAVLARAETVRLGVEALARQARQLVALGPVDIAVDDGALAGAEQRLVATTEPEAVVAVLEHIAGEGLGRDAYFEAGNRPPDLPTYAEVVRESAARLLEETAPRCGDPPCFLFWLSDGFPALDDAGIRAAGDLEAGLAADGWIVVAMALHVPTPDPDVAEPRPVSYEQWKAMTPGVKMAPSPGEVSRLEGLSASSFDFYVEPRYEPLRRAAIASCGAALRVEHQLEAEFERLERRLLLRFAAEAGGTDQEALAALRFLPVEVRLAEVSRFADRRRFKRWLGLVPAEERLRFARWIRSR
ncbi:MAG: hypothetical protein OXH32_16675 [Acidobacteria bacterium]|nr:hypothetical protein [Acidobacteriota bacterium]MXZ39593.1 hypothetical protein [Holophagales bacterium]MYJ27022.1 hypothetical protein [Holophagales bacterium]